MRKVMVRCSWCNKEFLKDNRHVNQNKKLGHRSYCSINCQSQAKNKQVELICANVACLRKFKRSFKEISPHNYCSRSCAAVVNNSKFPKIKAYQRTCFFCGRLFTGYTKNCSVQCRNGASTIPGAEIIYKIKQFFTNSGRIPLKREFKHYSVARKRFGTWNKAVEAAGFKSNPVMFARKQIAKDGHICDSIAEKLIDDYLFENGINHERNIPYPEGIYTADFKIGDKLIEYFGLAGEHKRYDELIEIKLKIVKKYKLMFVEIYPKDLYSKNGLEKILGV